MEVIIHPDAAGLTARLIIDAARDNPRLVLGLATGRTMERVYALLVEAYQGGRVDFSGVATFNLDEFIGISPDDERSYRHYMRTRLFDNVNLRPENTHLPDGQAPDIDAECRRYEEAIRTAGGIDLQLLGIGRSGHIGFNEPLSAMFSRTRAKALSPVTVEQNAALFGGAERVPRRAITMGVGTILDARRCILLATGAEKAEIVAKAVEGPVTSMISASALQLHPRCTVMVDGPASSMLQNREYYRWIFENEPEWEPYRGA